MELNYRQKSTLTIIILQTFSSNVCTSAAICVGDFLKFGGNRELVAIGSREMRWRGPRMWFQNKQMQMTTMMMNSVGFLTHKFGPLFCAFQYYFIKRKQTHALIVVSSLLMNF